MRKFRALLSVNLTAMLSSFRPGRGRKAKLPAIGALALMAFLALYLSGTYSFMMASQLAKANLLPLMFLIMPAFSVILGFVFTVFAAQGVIFGGKDNDLMLSMPISPFSLMLSRTSALYLENLEFSVFVMIPVCAAYFYYGANFSVVTIFLILIGTILMSMLPTLISMVCGFVLSWFTARFTRNALFSSLMYLVFFVLMMACLMQFNRTLANIVSYAAGIEHSFSVWGLPFLWFMEAVCQQNIKSLLFLVLICLLPFLLAVWVFGLRYQSIVTGLTARGARNDYKLTGTALSSSGQRLALLKKEAARFFGTPIYLFNTGFGLLMLAVGGIAAVVFHSKTEAVLHRLGSISDTLPMPALLTLIICFIFSTVGITASSISLEGKQLWILKEAPITAESLFTVKAGFQMLLCLPCLLIGVVGVCFGFQLSAFEGVLIFALGAVFALCVSLLGLIINLFLPKLDAPNDTVVVKQSASVLVSMLFSVLLVGAGVLVYLLLDGIVGMMGAMLTCLLLFAVCSVILVALLRGKGTKLFADL